VLRAFIGIGLIMVAAVDVVRAQDPPATVPPEATPITAHGSVDVGYRLQDVDGNLDTFRELFDFSEGPRIFGIDVRALGGSDAHRPFDTLTFNAAGVGEPFPTMHMAVRRSRRYDVRASWRRIRFFDVPPVTPASIDGFDTQAVTDHHSWSTSRQIGSVSATVQAGVRFQLLFGYDHVSRDGVIGSTRTIDFVGSPSTWGSFARANPYPVSGPVDDVSNRVTGGLSYSADLWTVHYKASYQSSRDTLSLDPLSAPQRSINVADPATAGELLSAIDWSQRRSATTPSSELSFVARPFSSIEWRSEYLYYRTTGPFSLDAAFAGTARTTSAAVTSPYHVSIAADGAGEMPYHIVGQGFTYRRSSHWAVNVDYRFSRMDSESTGTLQSVLSDYGGVTAPVATTEVHELSWRENLNQLRATVVFQPTATLSISPGVRFVRRDVTEVEDGVEQPATTNDENVVTPELAIHYRPAPWVGLRLVVRHTSNDAPYTRMSPSEVSVVRVIANFEPAEGVTIIASADHNDATQTAASFESRTTGASIHGSYALSKRLTAFGSLDYRDLLALGDTTFLRGTAPITDLAMRDAETDTVWQGGATIRVSARLDVTATGQYSRVRGTDEITGEPPLYGPQRFPFGTISVSYEIPRAGRLAVDYQRSQMSQELLPLDDYRATVWTIRFVRSF
jgi:predicted porin